MKFSKTVLFMFMILLFAALSSYPITVTSRVGEKRIYTTQHINPHAPAIDGQPNDPCWEKAEWGGDFIQYLPEEGKEPFQATRFKIMYDDKNLFVFIHALDSEPGRIERRSARRDDVDGDWVAVFVDSYFDRRTAFSFQVNAAGVKGDSAIYNNGDTEDTNWDPQWEVKTAMASDGWTAEMRIPLSQLRFASGEDKVWGLQVMRKIFRKQEQSVWQYMPRNAPGLVQLFGELRGFKKINAQHQKEILPYVVAKTENSPSEPGNPFATGKNSGLAGGLDGKIGVSSDLTLDFTINPDFGQVEADPSVINLTGFETFYQEKRPFFIEGSNIFNFRLMIGDGDMSYDRLFYTRRIGRTPQYYPELAAGEFADMPMATPIIGALKLTGKTQSGFSIGILDALTARGSAEIDFSGARRFATVEPLTNYFALRAQQDWNQGASTVGAMVTGTHRDIRDPSLEFLHSSAYSGGLDFLHSWKKQTYYVMGNFTFSHVRGTAAAIDRTQRSSVHYFQRPDADYIDYNPGCNSLSGHGGMFGIGKNGSGGQGGNLQYMAGVTWRSPGLELNDVGYLRTADTVMQWIWANYSIRKPFAIFRQIGFNFNQWLGWNFGGERTSFGGNVGIDASLKNYWGFGLGINPQAAGLSASKLRGGPAFRTVSAMNGWFYFSSDSRKALAVNGDFSFYSAEQGMCDEISYGLGVTYRPSRVLSLSFMPGYSWNDNQLQYVATASQDGQNRYILGRIAQKTLAVTIRLNWSLTPDLSIQFYGQPFISRGTYSDFKVVTSPRADQIGDRFHVFGTGEISQGSDGSYGIDANLDGVSDYSFANPDFNFLEFRSNLVLRWEYRPGAALYLVWSQGRSGDPLNRESGLISSLSDLINMPSSNVFLLKFTYNFNL